MFLLSGRPAAGGGGEGETGIVGRGLHIASWHLQVVDVWREGRPMDEAL